MNKPVITQSAPEPVKQLASRQDELRQQLNLRLLWELLMSEQTLPGQHLLWIEEIRITTKGVDV